MAFKISTKFRYGTRIMLELVLTEGDDPVSVKTISENQNLTVKYTEQLIAALKSADLVRSIRGKKGGYVLGRKPEEINLLEIFEVLEGNDLVCECLENDKVCIYSNKCVTQSIWYEMRHAIEKILGNKTLQDVVNTNDELFNGKNIPVCKI